MRRRSVRRVRTAGIDTSPELGAVRAAYQSRPPQLQVRYQRVSQFLFGAPQVVLRGSALDTNAAASAAASPRGATLVVAAAGQLVHLALAFGERVGPEHAAAVFGR